jgi:hypothetical protein
MDSRTCASGMPFNFNACPANAVIPSGACSGGSDAQDDGGRPVRHAPAESGTQFSGFSASDSVVNVMFQSARRAPLRATMSLTVTV